MRLAGVPEEIAGATAQGNVYFEEGPVCDRGWNQASATVVCRSGCHTVSLCHHRYLGYNTGVAQNESRYGTVRRDEEWTIDSILCQGQELSLADCLSRRGQDCLPG